MAKLLAITVFKISTSPLATSGLIAKVIVEEVSREITSSSPPILPDIARGLA